ncbi:hypothetical protein EON64_05730 [archaeon]|nr:MAG: hypothetical protein EON64_05730 [archaeon]
MIYCVVACRMMYGVWCVCWRKGYGSQYGFHTIPKPLSFTHPSLAGVIGALVKVDDPSIVSFLLDTEIIPLSLRIMEHGTELSRTVATFIVQKILLDDSGLAYVCSAGERFHAVCVVLAGMVLKLVEQPSARLLKHIGESINICAGHVV